MTHYQPARNAGGQVVGALFIGTDLTPSDAAVERQLLDARLFETGGVVMVDPRSGPAEAVFVVHPTAKGKKVVEAFPDAEPLLRVA